jgi:hypothetical protein
MASEIKVTINAKGIITGGKEVENGLQKIRSQAKQTQNDLKKAVQLDLSASSPQLSDFAGKIKSLSGGLGLVSKAGAAGVVIAAVGAAALHAADASERLNNALLGLRTVAKNTGTDVDTITKAAIGLASDGLIPLADVSASLKNLLSSGLSAEKSIKLFNALKDTSAFNRQGFLSMGEAIRGATEGIKNGNSILVDNAGVTKNLSIMHKEYAAAIGKTVGKLSEAEKKEAEYVGILRESEKFLGDAARAADTYTGAKARLGTAIERATAKLGDFITQSSLVKGSMNIISDYIDALTIEKDSAYYLKEYTRQLETLNKQTGDLYRANTNIRNTLADQIIKIQKIQELEKLRGAQGEYEAKQVRDKIAATKAQEEASRKAGELEAKRLQDVEKLKKQLIDSGKSELQALKDLRDRRLELAKGDADARLLIEKDYQAKVAALNKKSNDAAAKAARQLTKLKKEAYEALAKGASDPFSSPQKSEQIKKDAKLSREFDTRSTIGRGLGAAGLVTQGESGAQQLVSGVAAMGLDSFMPGLGQAAKPLLDAFAQGPAAVKGMVKEFTGALPDIVTGFIAAIPVFIETLADELPTIVERLAEETPVIIAKLVESLPRIIHKLQALMPKIAFQLASELIKNLPRIVSEAARAIYEAISEALSSLTGGASDAGKSANDWMGDNLGFKFARGGEVPSGAGTAFRDTVPSMLMGGERVLDRSTNMAFKRFVDETGGSGATDVLLARIINLLEQPMQVNTTAKVENKAFADIMLQMKRTAQRIS